MPLLWSLAIDFGTSNTAAAGMNSEGGASQAIPLSHTGGVMPSSIYVESPDSIRVGQVALNMAQSNPQAFVAAPKRLIGQPFAYVNGYDIEPVVLVTAVYRAVLESAVAYMGSWPNRIALTHPEAWSTREVSVLVEAGQRLGFAREAIAAVPEPVSAAAYYWRISPLSPNSTLAVFDFGGGTLDVAALQVVGPNQFVVLGAAGSDSIGGKNFDSRIRKWIDAQLALTDSKILEALRSNESHVDRALLEDRIRSAKEVLSEASSAVITVSAIGRQVMLTLTRSEYDELIEPDVNRAADIARQVVVEAEKATGTKVSSIYLTGGASRTPLVHRKVADLGPVAVLDDPKTVVSRGALELLAGTATAPARQSDLTVDMGASDVAKSGNRSRTVLAGAGAAAVLAVVASGVIGYWSAAGTSSDSVSRSVDPPTTFVAATPNPTTEAAAVESTSNQRAEIVIDPVTDVRLTTMDGVAEAIPGALREAARNCFARGSTADGSQIIQCQLTLDFAQFFNGSSYIFDVNVDGQQAAVFLRQAQRQPENSLRVSADGRAAAVVDPNTTPIYIEYADASTGVYMYIGMFDDVQIADEFLAAAGLF